MRRDSFKFWFWVRLILEILRYFVSLSPRFPPCWRSDGNAFHITGPLWGESTDDRGIPHTTGSNAELHVFFVFSMISHWNTEDNTYMQNLNRCETTNHYTITTLSPYISCGGTLISFKTTPHLPPGWQNNNFFSLQVDYQDTIIETYPHFCQHIRRMFD